MSTEAPEVIDTTVSVYMPSNALENRPAIWTTGTVEDLIYGHLYIVRLDDTGETVTVPARNVIRGMKIHLAPGDKVAATTQSGRELTNAHVVYVNALYACVRQDDDTFYVLVSSMGQK